MVKRLALIYCVCLSPSTPAVDFGVGGAALKLDDFNTTAEELVVSTKYIRYRYMKSNLEFNVASEKRYNYYDYTIVNNNTLRENITINWHDIVFKYPFKYGYVGLGAACVSAKAEANIDLSLNTYKTTFGSQGSKTIVGPIAAVGLHYRNAEIEASGVPGLLIISIRMYFR